VYHTYNTVRYNVILILKSLALQLLGGDHRYIVGPARGLHRFPNLTVRTGEADFAVVEDVVLEWGNRVDKRTTLDQAGGVRHEVQRPTTIILQQERVSEAANATAGHSIPTLNPSLPTHRACVVDHRASIKHQPPATVDEHSSAAVGLRENTVKDEEGRRCGDVMGK
jgi:hypothetical protein